MNRNQILRLIVSILTVLLCAALCASVVGLYVDGVARRAASGSATAPIFTRENVGAALLRVAPVFGLWVFAAVVAMALGAGDIGQRSSRDAALTLRLLRARAGALPQVALDEERRRKRVGMLCGVFAGLLLAVALAWLLNRENFSDWDLERVMGGALLHALLPAALAVAVLALAALWREGSRRREIEALQAALPGGAARVRVPLDGVEETPRLAAVRVVLAVVAAALIALGVLNGGLNDVLVKAINICTECIGLG